LTYRHGVKELAYSRAIALIDELKGRSARVLAYDPLLSGEEVAKLGAEPWTWGSALPGVRAVLTQTADPAFGSLDPAWFPGLAVLFDGRNSLRDLSLPAAVRYLGVGGPGQLGR
jgi:UDP-N-acetyl-D-mannosaminuronate dehydrogenase